MLQTLKNYYHLLEAIAANVLYGFPSKKIKVIGITGTDGKTTTTHLMYHILKTSNRKVSMSSSVYADIAGKIQDTGLHTTTQSRWKVQKNILDAVKNGDEYFVLETTSHSIDQFRVWGIDYKIGILTNVSKEHLDYHKNYDTYLATKAKMLKASEVSIINRDDQSYEPIKKILDKSQKHYKIYSLGKNEADYYWDPSTDFPYDQDYNKQNALAAYSACKELGLSDDEIRNALKSFQLPKGRFEVVYQGDITVIVDFAHTAFSIEQLLKSIKKDGRIIHVFGSAGVRDASKRPDMGSASGKYADIVILTEEDYRTDDFTVICDAISSGLTQEGFSKVAFDDVLPKKMDLKTFTVIQERSKAIDYAIACAKKGDTILLTGKGHERSLARGNKEYDWDEKKAALSALKNHGYLK